VQGAAGAEAVPARAGSQWQLVALWLSAALLAGALLLWAVRSQHTFLSDPPVWPDEALFAAPAVDLLQHGTFRTRVLEGLLTSAEHGTYWIPPGYPFVLAGAFALFSSSVEVMRACSMACALGVLLLVYALARRLELSRPLALLAPAWLAIDPVFGRGARVGRMDMLALLLVLAAVLAASDRSASRRKLLLAGVLAGLGLTVHPMAVVALPVVLAAAALREREQRAIGPAAIGVLVGSLPWTLWIARSPLAFLVQWAAQLIRKDANWQAYGAAPWSAAFEFTFTRYPPGFHGAIPWLYLVAFAGFAIASRRQREARLVLALYLLFGVAVLRAAEMWYTLYLTPFLPLGLLAPFARGALDPASPNGERAYKVGRVLAGTIAATFVVLAAGDAADALRWRPGGEGYRAWSARVVAQLPRNAHVLIAATPDPYFATLARPDLTVREFLPAGIPMPADRSAPQLLHDTDFVVIGRVAPSEWVADALRSRGRVVATIGRPTDLCYGRVFALGAPRTGALPIP
jgi:4-amino-4-deoxy-L-arabinose transferase-like glycosyltransferase